MADNKKMELVAPAGNWDSLVAAINAGADAVYLGLNRFSARAFAENFELSILKKAVAAAHSNGVKVYLAFNTLIKDSEIKEATGLLGEYFSFCSDGIIIQDMGLYQILSDIFPNVRIHASTQLSIHNLKSLELLSELKFARAVLAREMTLDEITAISQYLPGKELEVFAHGSQCYSYSGSCYFSSSTGKRSSNRGRCTQPCRMKYDLETISGDLKNSEFRSGKNILMKDCYILSKSDLFTLDILPELAKANITALKIEGRGKTAEYVGIITALYRKYIDLYYSFGSYSPVSKKDIYKATQIYSRNLGHGYFKEEFPKDIVSLKKSGSIGNFLGRITRFEYGPQVSFKTSKTDFNKPVKQEHKNKKRLPLNHITSFQIKSAWPISKGDILQVWTNAGNEQINVNKINLLETVNGKYIYSIDTGIKLKAGMGDRVFKFFDCGLDREAKSYFIKGFKNKPAKDAQTVASSRFLGTSVFEDYFGNKPKKNISNRTHGSVISNPSGCSSSSQEALSARTGFKVELHDLNLAEKILNEDMKSITINNFNQAINEFSSNIGLLESIFDKCRAKGTELIVKTPQIIYDKDLEKLKSGIYALAGIGIRYFSVSNFGVLKTLIDMAKSSPGIDIDIDFGFNVFNHKAVSFIHGIGQKYQGINIRDIGLSPELSLGEISNLVSLSSSIFPNSKSCNGMKKPVFMVYSYGYYPVMQSRFKLSYLFENKKGLPLKYFLVDRKGYAFRIAEEFNKNILFLSSKKICNLFDLAQTISSGANTLYIDTRTFTAPDITEIIRTYNKALESYNKSRLNQMEDLLSSAKKSSLFSDYTRGHLEREVL